MYKRIMVAVDGSETSLRGLHEAIALAKDQNALLGIIHVIDIVVAFGAGQFPAAYVETVRAVALRTIAEVREKARAAGIEPEVLSPEIVSGGYHVSESIVAAAKQWRADLLVVGTHGYRGFRRMLLGSVAEGVVRAATMPLLLVRQEQK
jgi:nucleotide-binding universal stress UspA family protein